MCQQIVSKPNGENVAENLSAKRTRDSVEKNVPRQSDYSVNWSNQVFNNCNIKFVVKK